MRNFRVATPKPHDQELVYVKTARYKNTITKQYLIDNPAILTTRTYDGVSNNLISPRAGSAGTDLVRHSATAYGDGIGDLAARNPTPRIISNTFCSSNSDQVNSLNLNNMFWMWGQFLDHEVSITPTNSNEPANMTTPNDDSFPNYTIPFDRSKYTAGISTPRQHITTISSYIDGTNVYGFNSERMVALRLMDGSGKLSTALADNNETIPPHNMQELENAAPQGSDPSDFFLCGDIRSNENIHLTAMHTLFIREHNRLCDIIVLNRKNMSGRDELIFQHARRIVYGEMQQITYHEFLPALLGTFAPSTTQNYSNTVDPGIDIEFSTVGYRFGHSLLPSTIKVGLDSNVLLKDAFFTPSFIQQNGIDDLLVGAANSLCNELNTKITDAIRNFLFGAPSGGMMLDLASLNIQRGRDHGIADYNTLRQAYGLLKVTNFSQITSDVSLRTLLSQTYTTVDDIDPWVGALAEDHLPSAAVGALLKEMMVDQFTRLRDGDRFWWERDVALSVADKKIISTSTCASVVKRNISVDKRQYIPTDSFHKY